MPSKRKHTLKKEYFFPSITTTEGSEWKAKIKEINELELKETALFLTGLNQKKRKFLYGLLKKSRIEKIPFVHLRSDMELWELDFLIKDYKTQAFNIHTEAEFPLLYDLSKYKHIIYVENTTKPISDKDLKNWAGICLDFSHLEKRKIENKDWFNSDIKMI